MNKLYSLHAPEIECIAKVKVRQPYEFGVTVSIATMLKEGFVVASRVSEPVRTMGIPCSRQWIRLPADQSYP